MRRTSRLPVDVDYVPYGGAPFPAERGGGTGWGMDMERVGRIPSFESRPRFSHERRIEADGEDIYDQVFR